MLRFRGSFRCVFSESGQYDSPDHITQPDLSVVCSKNQMAKNGCQGAPTIIIEVLSPATALKDFNEKFNLYQKYGVQEYWIVDPGNRTVHVYTLENGVYQVRNLFTELDHIQSIVFHDLQIPVSKMFGLEQQ
ncbi:Uma2 family endonuclease [Paenibacillus cellulosilyticus]|uniref:Uma2 family endonuclease n=1 Tax=Paenibacillus cellulosilyticus TaxID=375489 RepID=UPI001FECF76D|nr:Uma2 family endonuclease [Paenibacillus cellulosilyticus]